MNKNNIWIITPQTNLHVGNENASSYGLIDLAIQRDAVTGLPNINSSSLKGAIKEYADGKVEVANRMKDIFGSDKKGGNTQKGDYTFFDAQILALPIPSDGKLPYQMITSEEVLQMCVEKAGVFGITLSKDDLKKIIGNVNVVSHDNFKEYCDDDNLPIIARNVLEKGLSKNLWYEQVLPAKTIFFTIIDDDKDSEKSLSAVLNNNVVQVGANGSIGYGYCLFTHL